jgi:hypothetical protein
MEDTKWPFSFKDDEDRLVFFFDATLGRGIKAPPEIALAILVKSVERLKVSMDRNHEIIGRLWASTEESSHQANRLSRVIKNLTWILVGLAVVSLYIFIKSLK